MTQSQILVVVNGDTPLPLPADVSDIHLRFDDNIHPQTLFRSALDELLS
ncbi:hypothetical protein J2Y88_003261 [Pseudomonas chlororaphis]|nr:hypothetical protein [Pseudomonas chlororaphis]MCP1592698.1 hypothetical protein [Pseudomonas chlororaphis]